MYTQPQVELNAMIGPADESVSCERKTEREVANRGSKDRERRVACVSE